MCWERNPEKAEKEILSEHKSHVEDHALGGDPSLCDIHVGVGIGG